MPFRQVARAFLRRKRIGAQPSPPYPQRGSTHAETVRPRPTSENALMITGSNIPASSSAPPEASGLANFFSAAEARIDEWRQLLAVLRKWQAAAHEPRGNALFAEAVSLFGEIAPLEAFFAYPGPRFMNAIEQ